YRDSTSRTYVRARTLRTDQGRWLTEDPIGFRALRRSLYLYVHGRPTVLADPGGFQDIGDCPESGISCFNCVYNIYRRHGANNAEACLRANQWCGTDVPCWPRRTWHCTSSCPCNGPCPPCGQIYTGHGTGKSETEACVQAK